MIHIPKQEIIDLFRKLPGAISVCESLAIYNIILTSNIPEGNSIDLGSHAGKSSLLAACALQAKVVSPNFCMVDPAYDLTNKEAWKQTVQGDVDKMPWGYFRQHQFVSEVGLIIYNALGCVFPKMIGDVSLNFLDTINDINYIFIDSDDHQVELVAQEVEMIKHKVKKDGLVLFHDFKNQYYGPHLAYASLVSTGMYEKIDIDWDGIIEYVKKHDLEKDNDSWHNRETPFPNFIGGLRRI